MQEVWKNPWVRAGAALAVVLGVVLFALALRSVLVPLALAFLVAYLLDPLVDWCERFRVRRSITIAGLLFVILVALSAIPLYFIPSVIDESDQLLRAAREKRSEAPAEPAAPAKADEAPSGAKAPTPGPPDDTDDNTGWLESWESGLAIDLVERAGQLVPLQQIVNVTGLSEREGMEGLPPSAVLVTAGAEYVRDAARAVVNSYSKQLAQDGSEASMLQSLANSILGFVALLANIILFSFVTVYLLHDFDSVLRGMGDLVPVRYRAYTFRVLRDIDRQLRGFLAGQFTVILCLSTMYAIGLYICDTPFWLHIAVLGGLISLVPYIGPTLTIVPAALLTLFAHGVDWHILGVIGTFTFAQTLEGNVLTPNIVGQHVGLHPVWVILALLVFASLFGFLGLVLALPLAATLKVLVLEGVSWYKQSSWYLGESNTGANR